MKALQIIQLLKSFLTTALVGEMVKDKRSLRKALKSIVDEIDQSILDVVDSVDLEKNLAYIILKYGDEKKFKKEIERLKNVK